MRRNPSRRAAASSFEPGSVIATKWRAARSPSAAVMRSKKYALKMFGSSVEPDLLATTTSVVASDTRRSRVATWVGSVESSTCSLGDPGCGPNDSASTSGQRLEPPMPSSSTSVTPSARTSAANAARSPALSAARSGAPSQPSQRPSSASVQREASEAQSRRVLSAPFQAAAACAAWPRRGCGN